MTTVLRENDAQSYARLLLKKGISFSRLKSHFPDEATLFLKVFLFFFTNGLDIKSIKAGDSYRRIEEFALNHFAWIHLSPTEIISGWLTLALITEKDDVFEVNLKSELTLIRFKDLVALADSCYRKERETKRAQLIEKNHRINNAQMPPVDEKIDLECMKRALNEAHLAMKAGEVPVGAVLTVGGQMFCAGNKVITKHDPSAHAEMEVIRKACLALGNERLAQATLYVTLEPCPMCAAAIAAARISRVVWGADDPRSGAMAASHSVAGIYNLNHRALTQDGILKSDCKAILEQFFKERRQ